MARVVVNAAKMARGMEMNRMTGVTSRWKRLDMLYPMECREWINNASWLNLFGGFILGPHRYPTPGSR